MNLSVKNVFGMILLLIGISIVLQMIGISIGFLFRMIIPILIIIYGYTKMKRAATKLQKVIGVVVLVFGVLLLLGAAHLFIGLIVAGLVMYWGFKIMKGKEGDGCSAMSNYKSVDKSKVQKNSTDLFDEEWNRFMNDFKTK